MRVCGGGVECRGREGMMNDDGHVSTLLTIANAEGEQG